MSILDKKDKNLLFGTALNPVKCGHDIIIGGGEVIPEINFTLPVMTISEQTWPEVLKQYEEIISGVCRRAIDLHSKNLVVEFELLPPMTERPEWGAEITALLLENLEQFNKNDGLKSALRATVIDLSEQDIGSPTRGGRGAELTYKSAELCCQEGAHLLSIESTGGKKLHDQALMMGDMKGIICSLGVLAPADMTILWQRFVNISNASGTIPAGDSACAFSNTAMVLADKGMIPRILAAVIRVGSLVCSLEAFKQGAIGPSKDCAYEGLYLKAMLGIPISMEGKSSACAHLSHVGNIASASCDLWSNESIQNVHLLSGDAPVVSMEQLIYDCRLMNQSIKGGSASQKKLQEWLVKSDAAFDLQAFVLNPQFAIELAKVLPLDMDPLTMTIKAMDFTLKAIENAYNCGELMIADPELPWIDRITAELAVISTDKSELIEQVKGIYPDFDLSNN